MRVLHCADVHLDRVFRDLGPEFARRRRDGIRQAFGRVVDLAAELKVDALTIAGDLYEDEHSRQDTGRYLAATLGKLACPVLVAPGNHDHFHPGSLYSSQEWPDNVHIFQGGEFEAVEVAGIRFFGIAHTKPKGTRNLLQGYQVPEGAKAVALLHGSEQGQLQFQEEGKQDHAPFREADLGKAGFAYALVGHFHTPRSTSMLLYPGNPEPLTFGEQGERGAVEVDFAQFPPAVKVHQVNTFTVTEAEVDVGSCQHSDALVELVRAALPTADASACRVHLVGELALGVRLGPSELQATLRQQGQLVSVTSATRPAFNLEELSQAPDIRGQFVRGLTERPDADSPLVQDALRAGLEALRGEEPAIL
ncbi:MAG: metallophosphoesterase family protein [Candidatus Dormibacteria bacterium]